MRWVSVKRGDSEECGIVARGKRIFAPHEDSARKAQLRLAASAGARDQRSRISARRDSGEVILRVAASLRLSTERSKSIAGQLGQRQFIGRSVGARRPPPTGRAPTEAGAAEISRPRPYTAPSPDTTVCSTTSPVQAASWVPATVLRARSWSPLGSAPPVRADVSLASVSGRIAAAVAISKINDDLSDELGPAVQPSVFYRRRRIYECQTSILGLAAKSASMSRRPPIVHTVKSGEPHISVRGGQSVACGNGARHQPGRRAPTGQPRSARYQDDEYFVSGWARHEGL